MKDRALGTQGLRVSGIGLGCMPMSEFYGSHDDEQSVRTMRHAIEAGMTFFDTADMYGRGHNEQLVGRAVEGRRESVVIATKFGIVREASAERKVDGRPAYVRQACDASLKRLNVDTIDLYYQHRVDPDTPIEETVGAMKDLVDAGKVRYLGLSEASPETIRRAHKVHPISALQTEYSLWTRDAEAQHLATCRELGIGFVAYSPLGRGFLTGQIKSPEDLEADDWRRHNPRFQGENFRKNLELVARVEELAKKRGCTPAQLAIAWLLHQGQDIVPIPGTRKSERIDENAAAETLTLTQEDLQQIDEGLPRGAAEGLRYPEEAMAQINV